MMGASTSAPAQPTTGFTTLDREGTIDELPIEGTLPPWLAGSLIRTGPAKFEVGTRRMRHWFDGLAMLHRFSVQDGRISYANRYLESRAYRAARDEGRIAYSEFATDPCRSLFRRVQTLFGAPALTDNANVNVTRLGDRHIAMTETAIPVQFDARTLRAAGVAFRPPGQVSTAHPHADARRGGMLSYGIKLGPRSSYRFFHLEPNRFRPTEIAAIDVREPAYMHSFGLTERWLVLAEFPLVVNPLALALSGRPYIENFRWKPERGTRLTLVDRETGAVTGGFETDACFAFHHVNAYDEDDAVVVDVCTYQDAGVVQDLYLDRLRDGHPIARAAMTRFRLDVARRSVATERIADGLELPRIDYARRNARPYRYAWGVDSDSGGFLDRIVKVDVERRETRTWHEPGSFPGEPVFVARPDGEAEDDGVLLSVVLDAARESSYLLVLDAADLGEIARARVPHHIPFGFHGQFERGVGAG